MNKEQALLHFEQMIIEAKRSSQQSMFDWSLGRADGFILSLMYQGILTHREYADLSDPLLRLRFKSAD